MYSSAFKQNAIFSCGLLELENAGTEPDWDEFRKRIEFARDVRGLCISFQKAFQNEKGIWEVPFFSAHVEAGGQKPPNEAIARNTPYHVPSFKILDPTHVDLETLQIFKDLVNKDVASTWINDVMPSKETGGIKSPDEIFSGLIGMDKQKLQLMKIANTVAKRGRTSIDCFHFCFTGNPGTGKTELARRLVHYLDYLGITDGTGRFVKVGEADLVGKYVGWSAPQTKAAVESALGGVLFIDELYAIANSPHFGQEVIDALVDQLDAHRHDFVCIAAGYPDKMDETLDLNAGLRERFGYRIDFPDYTPAELVEIFCGFATERDFAVDCSDTLENSLAKLSHMHGFSNGRSVRNLVDECVCEACWAHDDKRITDADLSHALATRLQSTPKRRTIGF